jgi:hypothetical protein
MGQLNALIFRDGNSQYALRYAAVTFVLSSLVLGFYFYFLYPGILNKDHFHLILTKSTGTLFARQSNLYSLISFLLIDLGNSSSFIGFFQLLLSSFTLSYIIYQLAKSNVRKMALALVSLPFLFLPSVFLYTFSYHRDILFSWLCILLISILFFEELQDRKTRKNFSALKLVSISLIACTVGALRIDGVVFLVGALLLLVLKFRIEMKKVGLTICIFIVSFVSLNSLLFISPLNQYKNYPVNKDYYVTVVVNPLSYILRNRKIELSAAELDAIERIIDMKHLMNYEDDFNIPMVHEQKVKKNFTKEELGDFFFSSSKVFLRNPDLFLINRLKIFINILGVGRRSMYLLDDKVNIAGKENIKRDFRITSEIKSRFLRKTTFSNYRDSTRNLFWSSLWSLVLIILGVLSKRSRIVRYICLLFLLRTAIVFLLAPATHFIYLFSNYLVGFLLIPFYLVEAREIQKSVS